MDDPDAAAREWHVEQIDSDGDGGWDLAIFTGPHAEQRANRYAEQLADMSRSAPLRTHRTWRRLKGENQLPKVMRVTVPGCRVISTLTAYAIASIYARRPSMGGRIGRFG